MGLWVELISSTPKPEELIERAARSCYASECKGEEVRGKFLRGLAKSGHESPMEHASATFLIRGSRAFTHQLVRHRLASYSQKSQRYVKEENFPWVLPPSVQKNSEAYKVFTTAMHDTRIAYNQLIDLGIPKEDARYVLPNACETEIVMTANFREWRHFINLRADSHAQWEIREVAEMVLKQLYQLSPSIFEDLARKFFGDDYVDPKGAVEQ